MSDLEAKIASTNDPKLKIDLLNSLAVELVQASSKNLPRAVALCEVALELSQEGIFAQYPYNEGMTRSLQNLGEFYLRLSHYDLALSFLQRAQSLLKESSDARTRATIFSALGITYSALGEQISSLENYQNALTAYRQLGETREVVNVLINISRVYEQLGEYIKAENHLVEGYEIASSANLDAEQASVMANLARIYLSLANYTKAFDFGMKSLKYYQGTGNRRGEISAHAVVGDIYYAMDQLDKAEASYQSVLSLTRDADFPEMTVHALVKLGNLFFDKNILDKALEFFIQAKNLSEELNSRSDLAQCYRSLASIYKQLGDLERAITYLELYSAIQQELYNQQIKDYQKNQEILFQVESARKEAEIFHLKNVTLKEEVRQRKEMEEALTKINQELQSRIESHENLINDLNSFSYMVAHDLKTPLTNIALSVGILRNSLQQLPNSTGVETADRIFRMVEKMNHIINELLVLASVRKEEIITQPLDMAKIIEEVEARLERLVVEYNAQIIKPKSWPVVIGHAPWVEEVWENYMSNAIYYGGRPPRVEIGAGPPVGGMVRFWVRDNGSGLGQDTIPILFTAFAKTSSSRSSGHGLGLSIVKRIVEKLGGKVGVESSGLPGEGCTFYFTLPVPPKDMQES